MAELSQGAKLRDKEGVVLFVVLGTIFIVIILSAIILQIISSQSRLTHHQVSRIQAYYASQAGMVYALEELRIGGWVPNPPAGQIKYACLNGCVDSVTETYTIPADTAIPYHVQVAIYPLDSGINGTTRLDIKTEYTYTP